MDNYLKVAEHFVKTVICNDNFFSNEVINDISLLVPDIHEKLYRLFAHYSDKFPDDKLAVYETFRSQKRQAEVFKNGFSKIAKNGYHFFGCAFDVVFIRNNQPSWIGNFKTLREIGKEIGLHVNGSWDLCHFQFLPSCMLDDVRYNCYHVVKAYQKNFGLLPDGIPGIKTFNKFREKFYGILPKQT